LTILSPHTLSSVLHICHMQVWWHMHSWNCFAGASQIAPVLSNFGRMDQKLFPGRPWAHTSPFPYRNDAIIYCCSHAVDGHVFLLSECLHHYWCEFCQSWAQRHDPCWVHDPRRSWGIGVSVDCPCHSVEFPRKHFSAVGNQHRCRRDPSP